MAVGRRWGGGGGCLGQAAPALRFPGPHAEAVQPVLPPCWCPEAARAVCSPRSAGELKAAFLWGPQGTALTLLWAPSLSQREAQPGSRSQGVGVRTLPAAVTGALRHGPRAGSAETPPRHPVGSQAQSPPRAVTAA